MAANGAVDSQPGGSVVTFTTSSSQSSKSKRRGVGPTGRGGSGNIRRTFLPSSGGFEEDKVASPSGWEIKTSRGVQARTGRGGVEFTSKQRVEAARAFLEKEREVLAQHKQEMRRHEKQTVGRGGAGNLQRKKNTIVPKVSRFSGAQIGSKLFKTMTRSSRSSSERSVIDISRSDRDSDLWSVAESTMSRASTAGIIISKFGESLVGKRQQPTANPPVGAVTGVCYSDASSPSPKTPTRQACNYDVTSPYLLARTPNEVAPFEEPTEPSPLATGVFNSATVSSEPRRAESSMSMRPVLKRLIGGRSTNEYPPAPRSATSSTISYSSSYDDASSFDSRQYYHTLAHPTSAMKEHYRQPGVIIPLRPPPPRVDSPVSSVTNNFPPPVISTSASAALRMIARPPYDGDWSSDRTGVRSSGSSFYAAQYSGASTETESRNDHSAGKTPFPYPSTPSRRASTGRYGTPSQYGPSPSMLSVATAHSEASVPQFESFTPTFGVRKLPSLPAASLRSFDEFSLPSPPITPLPGSTYSEDAYDSDSLTTARPDTPAKFLEVDSPLY